ncbi:DNA repair protein rad2 [Trapelia coarctata]|nr:DNA repair protein rad2 [Trapelia coarctata]
MGVTGLWTVLQPCARPIKLETLNKKRLAVDASIWIYQFLKAVRDKEGNALRNSHVVGFFRRICKLLFFGIKPVFVFDGGAPALKRQTISGRKARREGRREDAVRTAGKLLAVQMQRRAEEEDWKRREERDRPAVARREDEEEEIPDNLVYVDELHMTEKERQQNRTFRKKDAYHLPDLDVSLADMGAPNDPRIMSHEELEEYARQFHTGEDINLYDFSKIDFNSPFFLSLPASDRYNILNAARLRSRLRMGYSKEQLDTMFPDRMAFSKFQVERVKERNELTQRLMNINGMNGEDAMLGINGPGRVAGEKGREYVLVKNDGVEGGWALGVVSNKKEGERNQPIDVERLEREEKMEDDDEWEDEDGFEDVPIEGLNRLPKRAAAGVTRKTTSDDILERRRAFYRARQEAAGIRNEEAEMIVDEDPDSLFFPQEAVTGDDGNDGENDDLFEDVIPLEEDEEAELQRAIAMSLEDPDQDSRVNNEEAYAAAMLNGPAIDKPLQFNQRNAQAGRAFAHLANARAHGAAPHPFVEDDDSENDMDFQAALAESRRTKYKPQSGPQNYGLRPQDKPRLSSPPASSQAYAATAPSPARNITGTSGFDGPLPFESLNLGKSILTKKKRPAVEDEGGFEKDSDADKAPKVIPPWFSGDIRDDYNAQKMVEDRQFDGGNPQNRPTLGHDIPVLHRQKTGEVIDLDAPKNTATEIIEVESSGEEDDNVIMRETIPVDSEIRMGDIADKIRAEPPESELPSQNIPSFPVEPSTARVEGADPDKMLIESAGDASQEELLEWDESDLEERAWGRPTDPVSLGGGEFTPSQRSSEPPLRSSSPEFENIGIRRSPKLAQQPTSIPVESKVPVSLPQQTNSMDTAPDNAILVDGATLTDDVEPADDAIPADDEDFYSDPEDDDLMRQLAVEVEEHARFASTLNAKSHLQSAEDYERELRQLRTQQKKDRRDADEVSHIMVTECQQLLKLFGLPYITAPMEAEAQCAELVSLGLVDGIVTDDSDIFLFGGTRVYKNMFNQAKFVECYLSSDLEKEYSLDREKIIQIAHLLGSDYTEGLPSVGPITALEILSEFETLDAFRDWWTKVQMGQSLPEDSTSPFRRKFKRNAAKLFLPPTFPDKRVDHAYLHPEVDSDPSAFAWGVPDLDALRQFLMATIGWSQERADEILVPVIKDMNRRENEGTQANITQFFTGAVGAGARGGGAGAGQGQGFAPRRRGEGKSRRMESALGRLAARAKERTHGEDEGEGEAGEGEEANGDAGEEAPATKKPKSRKRAAPAQAANGESEDEDEDEEYEAPRKATKRKRAVTKGKKAAKAS